MFTLFTAFLLAFEAVLKSRALFCFVETTRFLGVTISDLCFEAVLLFMT